VSKWQSAKPLPQCLQAPRVHRKAALGWCDLLKLVRREHKLEKIQHSAKFQEQHSDEYSGLEGGLSAILKFLQFAR
jgi:hypothetical protein